MSKMYFHWVNLTAAGFSMCYASCVNSPKQYPSTLKERALALALSPPLNVESKKDIDFLSMYSAVIVSMPSALAKIYPV